PFSDITTNGQGTNVQDVPDFATHLRYEGDLGHVQLSTIVRSIGYQPTGGDVTRRAGWGASASTVFHPWALLIGSNPVRKDNPTGLERSRILLQYSAGWGIGRYVQDTAGLGLDGQGRRPSPARTGPARARRRRAGRRPGGSGRGGRRSGGPPEPRGRHRGP